MTEGLHIAVCIKVVPRPEEVRVDPVTGNLERAAARSEFNPPDLNCLEAALRIKDRTGGRVSVISMGPPFVLSWLALTVQMGADHIYLLSDRRFAGADTLATTYTLARGVDKIAPVDLILCGEESSDGATAQVPPGLAEWLGWPQITYARALALEEGPILRATREVGDGYQIVETALPVVVSVKTAINEPRFPDFSLRVKEGNHITVWSADDLAVDESLIGQAGSPTTVGGTRAAPPVARKREMVGSPREAARLLADKIRKILFAPG
ncbi:MAG: electron transfer flavoprotein subunit beta/FixA family protein [Thermaerobacterales bacterium]